MVCMFTTGVLSTRLSTPHRLAAAAAPAVADAAPKRPVQTPAGSVADFARRRSHRCPQQARASEPAPPQRGLITTGNDKQIIVGRAMVAR